MPAIQSFSKPVVTILFLVVIGAVAGCDSSSSPGSDGDVDSPDITVETDDDAPGLDGDDSEDADETPDSDPDAEEAEATEPEADEGEEELDGDPEPEEELDLDPEVEDEAEWEEAPLEPGVIAVDELPWPGLTVTACAVDMNVDASLAKSRAVWGDDNGVVYFGGDAFWVLDETTTPGTLTCDTTMPHAMYSMDGRVTATGNELWTGHEGRIGWLAGGEWSFFALPAEMLKGSEVVADDRVLDIDIAGEKISVLTKAKLGLYTPATGQWQVVESCPEGINRDYGLEYDGAKLWLNAGVKLYSVALETAQVQEEVTVVEGAADGEAVGITGADEDGVWMVEVRDRHIMRYKDGEAQSIPVDADISGGYTYPLLALSPGMGGNPLLFYRFSGYSAEPGLICGARVGFRTQLVVALTDGEDWAVSAYRDICVACVNTGGCTFASWQQETEFRDLAAWRGTGQLWHMYKGPHRYRWNESEQ